MDEQHRIDTPVGQLAVRVRGAGQPAVLWHSLFVDDRSWDRMVPELSQQRRLVIITGPGHGTSGDPGRRYTNDECATAAVVVLDQLGIDGPVDWVGNAWGGHVGVEFAATWPERCRTLAMFGTPVAALTTLERLRTYALLGLYRLRGPNSAVVDGATKVLLSPHTLAQDPAAVRLVHDCLRSADRDMLRTAVRSISLNRTNLSDQLGRVTAATLIVTGADHHGFTPDQARTAATLAPNAAAAVVPDAAYLVPLEAPEHSTRLLHQFWADHPVEDAIRATTSPPRQPDGTDLNTPSGSKPPRNPEGHPEPIGWSSRTIGALNTR
jgi:pimeloyl-ACP methyl ester carboxylesterase